MSWTPKCDGCGKSLRDDDMGGICQPCIQRELAETRNKEHWT